MLQRRQRRGNAPEGAQTHKAVRDPTDQTAGHETYDARSVTKRRRSEAGVRAELRDERRRSSRAGPREIPQAAGKGQTGEPGTPGAAGTPGASAKAKKPRQPKRTGWRRLIPTWRIALSTVVVGLLLIVGGFFLGYHLVQIPAANALATKQSNVYLYADGSRRESADTAASVLRSVVPDGTAVAAQAAGRPAAGKTGTAEEDTAAWFAGYTPDLATVVAVMGQDPKTAAHKPLYGAMGLERINGGGAHAEIWGQYTRNALKGEPVADFDLQLQDGADVTAPPSGDASDEPGDGEESPGDESDEHSTGDQDGSGTETQGDSGSSTPPGDSGGTESDPRDRRRRPPTGGPSTEPGPTGGGDGGGGDDSSNGGTGPGGGDTAARAAGTATARAPTPARVRRHPRHTPASVTGGRLQTHHGDQQQTDEEDPGGGSRLPQHAHAEHRRPGRADAHPHAVGGTDGQRPGRVRQQHHARDDPGTGEHARPQPGETVGVLHPDRPADLEQTGDERQTHAHDRHLREAN
ncbi:hypothetical protein STENM327S_05433 [Streptomyces tendae]